MTATPKSRGPSFAEIFVLYAAAVFPCSLVDVQSFGKHAFFQNPQAVREYKTEPAENIVLKVFLFLLLYPPLSYMLFGSSLVFAKTVTGHGNKKKEKLFLGRLLKLNDQVIIISLSSIRCLCPRNSPHCHSCELVASVRIISAADHYYIDHQMQ